MYKYFFKRLIDFLSAFFGLIVLSPIIIAICVYLYFYNDGSLFFLQKRPGKDETIFKVIKFKTMTDKKDKNGNLLSDKERLTSVGKFIRKTSLDELPQLINVLKGEMSLIGPRPLLPEYLPLYNKEQKKRHLVKPGITGLAQVNGRNAISWEKKFLFDVQYVNEMSFLLDLKILFLTIKKVFKREGINQVGVPTTLPFKGSKLN